MANGWPSGFDPGSYIPTTDLMDTQSIFSMDISGPEFKQYLAALRKNINDISVAINLKDTGYYARTEFINGQQWFPDPTLDSNTTPQPATRQVFRKVYNCGPLPNATDKYIPHGIPVNDTLTFTRIYGVATSTTSPNPLRAIPLPYMHPSALNNAIALEVDNGHVPPSILITTAQNLAYFDTVYVVLEYIKT